MNFLDQKAGCYELKDSGETRLFEISNWTEFDEETGQISYRYSFRLCQPHRCSGYSSIPVTPSSTFNESNRLLSFEVIDGSEYRYLSISDILSDEQFTVKTLAFMNGKSKDPEHDRHVKIYQTERKVSGGLCP